MFVARGLSMVARGAFQGVRAVPEAGCIDTSSGLFHPLRLHPPQRVAEKVAAVDVLSDGHSAALPYERRGRS
jgi:hypothetical protein